MSSVCVLEIVAKLLSDPVVIANRTRLSHALGTPPGPRQQWENLHTMGAKTPEDHFLHLLENWVERQGSKATLGNLKLILKKCNFINAEESLNEFGPDDTLIKSIPDENTLTQLPIWHACQSNKNFGGRVDELERIEESFNSPYGLLVILGLGGIGKSELAKRFGELCFEEGRNVISFDAGSQDALTKSALALADKLKLPFQLNDSTPAAIFQKAYESCLNSRPTLLILDNVDMDEVYESLEELVSSFQSYSPGHPPIFLLVTSKNRNLLSVLDGDHLELGVFKPSETMALLNDTLLQPGQEFDVKVATTLCETLENFPLAVSQCVAYILFRRKSNKSYSIPNYLVAYETEKERIKILGYSLPFNHLYKETTFTTWNLSFQSIISEPELGSVAEQIMKYWVYIENPNKKLVQYLINCYEVVEQITNSPESDKSSSDLSQLSDEEIMAYYNLQLHGYTITNTPRHVTMSFLLNKDTFEYKPPISKEETDIMDDTRVTARAIQLIRNHSIVSVEFGYSPGYQFDTQILALHSLVLEVMQLQNKYVLKSEAAYLSTTFEKFLLRSAFRKWSVDSAERFYHRISILDSLSRQVAPYQMAIEYLAEALLHLSYDSLATSLISLMDNPFPFNLIFKTLAESLGPTNPSTIAARVYQSQQEFAKFVRNPLAKKLQAFPLNKKAKRAHDLQPVCDTGSNLHAQELLAILNLTKQTFPKNSVIFNHARGLIVHAICFGLLDPSSIGSDTTFAQFLQLVKDVTNIFGTCKNADETFSTLCLIGGILELQENSGFSSTDLAKFASLVSTCLNEQNNGVTYTSKFLERYIANDYALSTNTVDFQNILLEIAQKSAFCMSPSLVAKSILIDLLSCRGSLITTRHLTPIFDSLWNSKNSQNLQQCSILALQSAQVFCEDGNYSSAMNILTCLKSIEQKMWEKGMALSCLLLWNEVILLGQHCSKLSDPHFIPLWMDNILEKAATLSEQELESFSQIRDSNPNADTIQSNPEINETPTNSGSSSNNVPSLVVAGTNMTLTQPDIQWSTGEYQAWQSSLELVSQSLNSLGIDGYGDTKVAGIIAERYFNPPEIFVKMSPATGMWAIGKVLASHPKLITKVDVISKVVEIMAKTEIPEDDANSLSKAGGEMYRREKENFATHQGDAPFVYDIPRIYMYLYTILIFSEKQPQVALTHLSSFFGRPSESNGSEILVTTLGTLQEIMTFQKPRLLNPIVIKVLCKLIGVFFSAEQEFTELCRHAVENFVGHVFNKLKNAEHFSDLAGFCAELLSSVPTDREGLSQTLLGNYHLVNVGSLLWNGECEGVLEMYATFLKEPSYTFPGVKDEIRADLICRMNKLVSKEVWSNLDEHKAQDVIRFLITEGVANLGLDADMPETKQLVERILKNMSPQNGAVKAFSFGLSMADTRSSDRDLLEFVVSSVLRYLEEACKTDTLRMKAIFDVKMNNRTHEPRKQSGVDEYIKRVSVCLGEFGIVLKLQNQPHLNSSDDESDYEGMITNAEFLMALALEPTL